jgi:transposase
MNIKRQYKTYTSEFKTKALGLVNEQGYTILKSVISLRYLKKPTI